MPLTCRAVLLGLAAGLALQAPLAAFAACQVDGRAVAFGSIDVTRKNVGVGDLTVDCDQPVGFEIGIARSGSGERAMRGPGGARLRYDLFSDSGHNRLWGDDNADGDRRAGTSDGGQRVKLPVYGVVPAQPGTPPGDYTDQLAVTLYF